jgi:hypothetical protein
MVSPALALLSFSLISAGAQTSPVPYDSINGGPTFAMTQVNQVYPGAYSTISAVNFRDFAFPEFDESGRPVEWLQLTNGSYQHDEPNFHSSASFESVYYLAGPASIRPDSALVLLSWSEVGGSSSQGGLAYVFKLVDRHLRLIQAMDWDTHFQTSEPTDVFDQRAKKLVIRTAHYIPGDAHCCVSAMDVITLQWDGTSFAKTDLKTELSDYGKSEHKELPH